MDIEELEASFNGLVIEHKLDLRVNYGAFLSHPTGVWALDVEHDEQGGFVGCGLYNGGTSYYFNNLLSFCNIDFSALSLVCHNGVSDFDVLRSWGINVNDAQLVWDTGLIAHIIDSSRPSYGLKALAEVDLNIVYPSYADIVGKRTLKQVKERRTLDKWPTSIVASYNAMDTFATWQLYELQKKHSKSNEYFEQIERPVAFILASMENRGICVDLYYLECLKIDLELQRLPIERQIKNELGNINLNSPKQLLEALNAKEIYPTFKGKPSTDKRALESLKNNPIIRSLLSYSELSTLLSSFVTPYLERGQAIGQTNNVFVVHSWFNQCGTRTGRLSCSNPNLLQIPKKGKNGNLVRNMFVPRPGMLLGEADYGAIEPRVLAHFSKDPGLCGVFARGENFHEYTRKRLGFSADDAGYAKAKVLNLSVGYRATFKSVQMQLNCSKEEAQDEINKWWALFPALRRWQESLIFESKRSGYCQTLMGRRIKIEGLSDGNSWKREHSERQLINNLIQGSAAELIKLAMLKIVSAKPQLGLLIQIYDSLVFESAQMEEDGKLVVECMESAYKLEVPLVAELKTGPRWGELKCS